jgi:hypothetical protein
LLEAVFGKRCKLVDVLDLLGHGYELTSNLGYYLQQVRANHRIALMGKKAANA